MALRYNDQTGEFEEEGGGGSTRRRTRRRSASSTGSSLNWREVITTVGMAIAVVALGVAGDSLFNHIFKKGGS
ncbi:MAG: hypothetical protein J5985_04540 [Kiritimatiellae bacterium]|nr:hypothetical protein [Kiritimatiellia bacterium]